MKIISNLPDTDAGTTERPDGALADVSAPAAGDGTPAREDWMNDLFYAFLAVMNDVGVSADDTDEEVELGTGASQFLDAMRLFVQYNAYPGLDFGLKNISAGAQVSNITIYETGGGSEKEDGFTVRLRWTGGTGTFAHTITSAYTIGNELAGFLASSAWQGDGAGELVLRLDKTNSKWLVLSPGIWDSGSFTEGDFQKHTSKDAKMIMWGWVTGGGAIAIATDLNNVLPVTLTSYLSVQLTSTGYKTSDPSTRWDTSVDTDGATFVGAIASDQLDVLGINPQGAMAINRRFVWIGEISGKWA